MTIGRDSRAGHSVNPALCLVICYAAYSSIYVARLNLSMASADMIEKGILDPVQIGMLGTVFSVIYAGGRLINSSLADRVVPWMMMTIGLLTAGLANTLVGVLPPYILMAVLWGMNAWGQSMLWGSVLRVVSGLYDPGEAKKKMAVMATTLGVGNVLGIVINTGLIDILGIRAAFLVPGTINLVLSLLCRLVLYRVPFESARRKESILTSFRLIVDPKVRSMLLPAMFHGVMKDNISLWMAVFFVTIYGIDLTESSWYILLIPLVGLFGRMLYRPVYRLCRENEHRVSFFSFVVCIAASVLLLLHLPPLLAAVCLALIFAAVSLINTSILSIFPLHYAKSGDTAAISGITDLATYLGAAIGSAVYGAVIGAAGNVGYQMMFASWAVISVLSLLLLIPAVKNTKD